MSFLKTRPPLESVTGLCLEELPGPVPHCYIQDKAPSTKDDTMEFSGQQFAHRLPHTAQVLFEFSHLVLLPSTAQPTSLLLPPHVTAFTSVCRI